MPISLLTHAIKALAIAMAVISAVWWWNSHNSAQQQIGYDKAAGEYAVKLAEAKDAARIKEQGWFLKNERATNERIETEKKLDIARAASRAAAERLRIATSDFSQRLSAASLEACRNAAGTAAELLGECSAAYRQVADAADGHAADAEQCLSAWPG